MTQSTLSPERTADGRTPQDASATTEQPHRRRQDTFVGVLTAETMVASCIALHLVAAAVMYRDMARDLYTLFDATPRLLILEHGLVRLTAISVFLPPVVPSALLGGVALWLGRARRDPEVAHWLALAAVPLALDTALRAVGVVVAPTPANIGELLDLPSRFSPGPRMVLDFVGVQPSPGVAYWVVICTVAAAISGWYVARALCVAESLDANFPLRRRPPRTAAIDALRAGTVVAGTWILLAFAGQVALPWATQLVLRIFA